MYIGKVLHFFYEDFYDFLRMIVETSFGTPDTKVKRNGIMRKIYFTLEWIIVYPLEVFPQNKFKILQFTLQVSLFFGEPKRQRKVGKIFHSNLVKVTKCWNL